MAKGTLIPIGGNEDKGEEDITENYAHDFVSEGILFKVVKESGGVNSNIIVIPTASSIQDEVSQNYLSAFDKLGCKNVEVLDINTKKQASSKKNIKALEMADCVMFTGGDQSKIVRHISGTKFHKILSERYENEQFVIAGTSAGAMCMSNEMIAGGSITESLFRGSVEFKKGMNFIPELIIDSHFIKRRRFGRLTEAVAAFPKLIGVGLSEDTGIIIKDGIFRVIGSGMVVIFDPSGLSHNYREILDDNLPLSMTDLRVHVLAYGDKYEIKSRRTCVMTLEEYRSHEF